MGKTISLRVRIFAVIGIMLAVLGLNWGPHADVVGPWLRCKADGFIRYHTDDAYRAGVDSEKYQREQERLDWAWTSKWYREIGQAQRHMMASGMDPKLAQYLVLTADDDIALQGGFYVDGFWQDMDIVLWGKNCINRKGDLVVLELEDSPVAFIFPDAPDAKVKN